MTTVLGCNVRNRTKWPSEKMFDVSGATVCTLDDIVDTNGLILVTMTQQHITQPPMEEKKKGRGVAGNNIPRHCCRARPRRRVGIVPTHEHCIGQPLGTIGLCV